MGWPQPDPVCHPLALWRQELNVTLEGRLQDTPRPSTSPRHKGVLGQAVIVTQKLPLPQPHARLQMQPVPLPCPFSCAPGYSHLLALVFHQSDLRLTEVMGTSCSPPRGHIEGILQEQQPHKHASADQESLLTDMLEGRCSSGAEMGQILKTTQCQNNTFTAETTSDLQYPTGSTTVMVCIYLTQGLALLGGATLLE